MRTASDPLPTGRAYRALLGALAVDNFGTGVFLPLTMVWLVHRTGLSLPAAAAVLTVGTVAGTLMPALAARLVDRTGARTLVAGSQLLQATGMTAYLLAHGLAAATGGAVLMAAGTQLFYATLNTMTTDVVPPARLDEAFAQVGMARGVGFALGGLVGGALLTSHDPRALPAGVVLDIATFVTAAVVLTLSVPAVRRSRLQDSQSIPSPRVLQDRPYLVLLVTTAALMLTVELFLLATPVYAHDRLGVPGWAVGAQITVLTALGVTLASWVVRHTARWRRTTCLLVGAGCFTAWVGLVTALQIVPSGARAAALLAAVPLFSAGNLLVAPRLPALVGVIAPPEHKGAYFAYFQYAFTAAQLVCPLVVATLDLDPAAPWLLNLAFLGCGVAGTLWLRTRLPRGADVQTVDA